MDPVHNPYAPGAGTPPPELAGREKIREQVRIALERIRLGLSAKSLLLIGLRGVGKTVLLEQMRRDADASGLMTITIEAPEHGSLPALLAPKLRLILLKLSQNQTASSYAKRGLSALAGFAKTLKVKFQDIEVSFDAEPEPGLADNGNLENDLTALLEQVGIAAQKAGTVVVLFVDEIQYLESAQFAALISALHRCAQSKLPLTLVGAGLPQVRGLAGNAKSYAERLFDYPEIGPLSAVDAERAIRLPAWALGVNFADDAVAEIIAATRCYPYFLQEWGKHSWDIAQSNPITLADAKSASEIAVAALDESFFRVRFDRLTPQEKRYLRVMAELGPGPHRSGDIAQNLGKAVNLLGPVRQKLINKGMIWSPSHGDTAFTVPLFDEFMKRITPFC
jgi:hypothetical protein